jgi:RNA polymerase sigma-70 factor (ECF subfamily)
VTAAQDGDRDALDTLLRAHIDRVHGLCRRLCGNDADAEDATQEALVAIVKGLPRFDGRSSFSTWVHRVTTNACLDELRRRARRPQVIRRLDSAVAGRDGDGRSTTLDPPDRSPTVEERLPDRLAIDDALALLPEEFRVAVVLRDHVGLDYAEIATLLDLPPGTVRSRIARGRGRLADLLGPVLDQGNPVRGDDVQGTAP